MLRPRDFQMEVPTKEHNEAVTTRICHSTELVLLQWAHRSLAIKLFEQEGAKCHDCCVKWRGNVSDCCSDTHTRLCAAARHQHSLRVCNITDPTN